VAVLDSSRQELWSEVLVVGLTDLGEFLVPRSLLQPGEYAVAVVDAESEIVSLFDFEVAK
jgi:hypothetical protein